MKAKSAVEQLVKRQPNSARGGLKKPHLCIYNVIITEHRPPKPINTTEKVYEIIYYVHPDHKNELLENFKEYLNKAYYKKGLALRTTKRCQRDGKKYRNALKMNLSRS